MEKIGTSSIWVERYRCQVLKDYICTDDIRNFVQGIIDSKEVPHLLLEGIGGTGKTNLAQVIANELDMDLLYINGSLETSIDTIRYKVTQFVTSHSLHGGKKLVIIDEADRMSIQALESLKVLVEQSEAYARFIFCTNNLGKIIQPLQSRCQLISFGKEQSIDLIKQCFKRVCFILTNEKVTFDKAVVADLTKKYFPDMRKLVNEVQKSANMFGTIDERSMNSSSTHVIENLIEALKAKKFSDVRKFITECDLDTFYRDIYVEIEQYLQDSCKPNVILEIGEWQAKAGSSMDREIPVVCLAISIMQTAEWK